jgi:drug/metabolite transporter (DMT)-like permease
LIFWNESLSVRAWLGIALVIVSGMLSLRLAPTNTEVSK